MLTKLPVIYWVRFVNLPGYLINIDLNAKDSYFSKTALHYACMYGHLEIVEMFMQKSAMLNIELNAKDRADGRTAQTCIPASNSGMKQA